MNYPNYALTVTAKELIIEMDLRSSWQQKFKYLVQLGQQLPVFSEYLKEQMWLIPGCENKVWLGYEVVDQKIWFYAQSEPKIIRGLLVVILCFYQGCHHQKLQELDITSYLDELELGSFLSPTRTNSVQQMIAYIQQL